MKNSITTLLLTILVSFSLKAQLPELKKIIKSADDRFEMQDYYGAEKLYVEAYSIDSTDATVNFRLGVCKFEMKDYKSAEQYFIKSSSAVSLEIFRYKAAIAHADKKFKKAINYYNAYKIINGEFSINRNKCSIKISWSI